MSVFRRRSANRTTRIFTRPHLECLEDRVVPTFLPAVGSPLSFPTNQPFSVAVGDLNGDGKQDLVIGNGATPGSLIIETGNGDGTFHNAGTISIGSGIGFIRDVAVVNLDGGQFPDLVATAFSGNKVVILQNTTTQVGAAPTFTVANTISVGTQPFWITTGDFDEDGKLDIATANNAGNSITIIPNKSTGPGNFNVGTPVTLSLPGGGRSVEPIEINGKLDLVATNFNNGMLSIFQNTSTPGNISFNSTPSTINLGTGSAPNAIAIGDFNNDGLPDIAASSFNTGNIYLMLNQGNGTFSSPITIPVTGVSNTVDLIAGDFNGDGNTDLAVVGSTTNNVAVLYGNGAGAFPTVETYATSGVMPWKVASGDFNNDGAPDLVVTNLASDTALVLLNQAAATAFRVVPSTTTPNEDGAFTVTVTAMANGVPYVNYTGSVILGSNDPLMPILGSHTFVPSDKGTYTFTVSLRSPGARIITAGDGKITGSSSVTVQVVPPTLTNVQITSSVIAGSPATLTGNISAPNPLAPFTLVINWGDGSPLQTVNLPPGTTSFSVPHTYLTAGVHSVSVSLSDNDLGGGIMYGSDTSRHLFTLNLTTGAATPIGTLPGTSSQQVTEIAYNNFNDTAWLQYGGAANEGQQFNIATAAGIGSVIANVPGETFTGMTYDGGILYASGITGAGPNTPSDLRILNPATGQSTLIGMTGVNNPMAGLAYDAATGVLYGLEGGMATTNNLFTIDTTPGTPPSTTTNLATPIASTGFAGGSLAFGPDGMLYAGANNGKLYRIDPVSHQVTLVGTSSSTALSGLALVNMVPPVTVGTSVTVQAPSVADVLVQYGTKTMSLTNLTRDLPWTDITVIQVAFTANVIVTQSDLTLAGINVPSYAIAGFSYNSATKTATWTLKAPIKADRLTLTLNGLSPNGVHDAYGNYLQGGNFVQTFNVLPGDFNGDGVVDSRDMVGVRNEIVGLTAADIWGDLNGDGTVNMTDYNLVRRDVGTRLP